MDANKEAITAIATVAIAAFTLVLWIATSRQARLARESIDLGNRTFIATHRPKIVVNSTTVKTKMADDGICIGAEIAIVNAGESNAMLESIKGDIVVGAPSSPQLSAGTLHPMLTPGEVVYFAVFADAFASTLAKMNKPGQDTLWLVGVISYADADGRRRQTGFCRSYNLSSGRWDKEPNSDYEYAY